MKIASKIHNRDGSDRHVTIHDQRYVFAKVVDKDERTHYVAEVKNEEHAAVLMGHDAFYQYGDELAPKPTLKKTAPPPPPADDVSPEIKAEVDALLLQSASKISTALGHVSSPEVIKVALATELAKDDARKVVVTLLKTALEGAVAAGLLTD